MNKIFLTSTIACFLAMCVPQAFSQPLAVNTMAGQPIQGSADGFAGVGRFRHPNSLAADHAGVIYVADTENSTIRRIATNQVVSTFAGLAGNLGSLNGTGTNAQFFGPQGIAVDGGGILYVADTANATIRKITSAGVVSTLAGSAGIVNSFDGLGTNAQFFQPESIAVDTDGNIYVADTWNHTIRKITSAGVVTTLAGLAGHSGGIDGTNSKARFNRPSGIAVDHANNVFVADLFNHTIRKITSGGTVSTIAGLAGVWGSADGSNNAARFFQPQGIVADNSGNLIVVDSGNHTIRKISSIGTNWVVSTVAGSSGTMGSADGVGNAAQFYFPAAVARDGAGYLYVADSGNNMIRTERPLVNYLLNTSVYPSHTGTIFVSPDQPMYSSGDVVTLTATANAGFAFVGWSGDVITTSNQIDVSMTTNKSFVANFISAADLIVDNPNARYSGVWTIGTSSTDKYGSYYQYAATVTGSTGIAVANYTPNIITAGQYDVSIWYPQGSNRSTRTPVLVGFDGGSVTTNINQTTGGGSWRLIAERKDFALGTNGFVSIQNNTGENNKVVMADAVRFTYVSKPIFYSHPQTQKVAPGSNVHFHVLVGGSAQLTYQWQFNEENIPGATNSSYTRTNVQSGDVGGYAVVVSNPIATVTSDVAAVSLLPSNRFESLSILADGRFHFAFGGEAGVTYAIEASTNFTDWNVVTNLSSPDGILDFTEPLPKLEKRFFRARSSP